jgi:outer membrane protein assembly factor BamB
MVFKVGGVSTIDANKTASAAASVTFGDATVQTSVAPSTKKLYSAGSLVATLNNPNAYSTSAGDNFGNSVAISGNYAIVGAYYEDDVSDSNSGKAYIYNVTTGALLWTLNNPNAYSTSAGDYFGMSVAISGNYAIVGASYESDLNGTYSGKAYIFNVTTGQLLWTLNNPNAYSTSSFDQFGGYVAISSNYAIVSAYNESDSNGFYSGKAYIFNVTTGQLLWTLNDPNAYSTSAADYFGKSVAISGNYAIVGASGEADAGGSTSGKAYIFNVTTGALLWTLNNPNAYSTSAGDEFGRSLDISSNYAIVGAYNEGDSSGTGSGKAYIFNVTTGQLLWTLNNPNAYSTSTDDNFGRYVSISGNYAIVGAYQEDDVGGGSSGKAYIFNVTTGQLLWTLNDPNAYSTSAADYFGYSVAISGNYAIVGASSEDDASGLSSGKAYIFALENITQLNEVDDIYFSNDCSYSSLNKLLSVQKVGGELIHTLSNPNPYSTSQNDQFGYSIAISGNYAIVGTLYEDDTGGTLSGKAYIYNVTTGQLVWTLNNSNAYSTSTDDNFGCSVDISGNYAIVGAYGEDDTGGTISGKAYIYNVTTGQLVWTLNNPNAYSTSANDYFGVYVSISSNYAIVGAYGESDSGGGFSGKVYVFNVTTGQLVWTLNNPNAYSTSASDFFGSAVATSGNYVIVGVYSEDDITGSSSGKTYIFNMTTGQLLWTLNNPNPYSTGVNDWFGYSVAISGNYAIVGAPKEDDSSNVESGKAYIFNVTTGALLWTLNNPNAYSTTANDFFGWSVAISGNYVIVGAHKEADSVGVNSGKAYIFNVTTGQLLYTLNNPNAYSTSASDYFGWLVDVSGNYAIVSAYQEDDAGGAESGKAYIFAVDNLTYLDRLRTMVE